MATPSTTIRVIITLIVSCVRLVQLIAKSYKIIGKTHNSILFIFTMCIFWRNFRFNFCKNIISQTRKARLFRDIFVYFFLLIMCFNTLFFFNLRQEPSSYRISCKNHSTYLVTFFYCQNFYKNCNRKSLILGILNNTQRHI